MYPTASSTKHRYQAYPNNSPMSTGSSTATPGQNLSFGYNSRYPNVAPTGPPPPPRSPSAASYASASTYRDNYKRQDYSYPYDTRRRPGGYDDETESRASLSTSAWGTTVTPSSPRSSLLSASISESGSESEESVGFDPRTRYSAGSGSRSRTYGMGATPTTPAGGYRAEYTPHAGGTRTSVPPMERTISQSWGGSESSRSSFSGFAASQTSSWSGAPNTEQSRSEDWNASETSTVRNTRPSGGVPGHYQARDADEESIGSNSPSRQSDQVSPSGTERGAYENRAPSPPVGIIGNEIVRRSRTAPSPEIPSEPSTSHRHRARSHHHSSQASGSRQGYRGQEGWEKDDRRWGHQGQGDAWTGWSKDLLAAMALAQEMLAAGKWRVDSEGGYGGGRRRQRYADDDFSEDGTVSTMSSFAPTVSSSTESWQAGNGREPRGEERYYGQKYGYRPHGSGLRSSPYRRDSDDGTYNSPRGYDDCSLCAKEAKRVYEDDDGGYETSDSGDGYYSSGSERKYGRRM